MRKPEQKLWDTMKRQYQIIVPPDKIYMDRIENMAGEGQPDVHCRSVGRGIGGFECWIELKVAVLPKRESTRVMGDKGLNPNQINWHLVHSNLGLPSYILLRDNERGLYLIPGYLAKDMNDFTKTELRICTGALSWNRIFQVIRGINI